MKLIFRVFLSFYALLSAIISVYGGVLLLFPDFLRRSRSWFYETIVPYAGGKIVVSGILFAFAVVSIAIAIASIRIGKKKAAVNKKTEIGNILITLSTLESMALSSISKVAGIAGARVLVLKKGDAVAVSVKLQVLPDISIPTVSEKLQNLIKANIEDNTGFKVDNVRIVFNGMQKPKLTKQTFGSARQNGEGKQTNALPAAVDTDQAAVSWSKGVTPAVISNKDSNQKESGQRESNQKESSQRESNPKVLTNKEIKIIDSTGREANLQGLPEKTGNSNLPQNKEINGLTPSTERKDERKLFE